MKKILSLLLVGVTGVGIGSQISTGSNTGTDTIYETFHSTEQEAKDFREAIPMEQAIIEEDIYYGAADMGEWDGIYNYFFSQEIGVDGNAVCEISMEQTETYTPGLELPSGVGIASYSGTCQYYWDNKVPGDIIVPLTWDYGFTYQVTVRL